MTGLISIDDAFAQNSTNQIKMKIDIEIMNIGKIDKETGSYDIIFGYLSLPTIMILQRNSHP